MSCGFVHGAGARPLRLRNVRSASSTCTRTVVKAAADGADGDAKKAFGMFGGMGKFMDAMKKAQELAKDAKSLQQQMANTELETSVRDGLVVVKTTGNSVPISVEVSDELIKLGADEVSAACTEAFIQAHKKSQEYMQTNLMNSFGLQPNEQGQEGGSPPNFNQ